MSLQVHHPASPLLFHHTRFIYSPYNIDNNLAAVAPAESWLSARRHYIHHRIGDQCTSNLVHSTHIINCHKSSCAGAIIVMTVISVGSHHHHTHHRHHHRLQRPTWHLSLQTIGDARTSACWAGWPVVEPFGGAPFQRDTCSPQVRSAACITF